MSGAIATVGNDWQMTPLREILIKSDEWIDLKPEQKYQQVTVRMWGQGVVKRGDVTGVEVASKRMLVVHPQQFIVSRIDARHGASGLIPDVLEGAIVTNDFPVFIPNPLKILPKFLSWMSKTHAFVDLCIAASEGTTNRVRLKEDRFLAMQIPLPSLEEQRRVVARIEELAAKVEEARGLRSEAIKETEALITAALTKTFDQHIETQRWSRKPLRQAAEIARGKFTHRPRNDPRFYGGDIPFIQIGDISNSNRYIQKFSQTLNDEGLKISRLFPKDTIVIAITGATIGVTGILTFDSCFPDSIVGIVPHQDITTSDYIYWAMEYCKQSAIAEATQSTQPNINLKNLEKLTIPIPSISEQYQIVAHLDDLQAKVDTLKKLQSETEAELNALLPSILDKAFKGEL